jgi:hypothetical protein
MNLNNIGHRAAILITATFSLTAIVLAFVVRSSAAAPVPWVDQSGSPLVTAQPHAQRSCRTANLKIGIGRVGAFHGQATQELLLTNVATEACAFPGAPTGAALLDSGGQRILGSANWATNRLDLAPGQSARLVVGTPGACVGAGHPDVASTLRLALATGETASVSGVWVNVECGPPQTILFIADAMRATRLPASGLQATLSAPADAVRGQTLSYMVVLSNPTATRIALTDCPSYTESLGVAPATAVTRTLLLNCRAAPRLDPGHSLAFEMQLSVPQTMTPGVAKLSWHLAVPDGVAVGTTIVVS